MNFQQNSYRRNPFDVFPLRKDETNIRNIRQQIQQGRNIWSAQDHTILARDGSEWDLTEAELNSLEKEISEPLPRLQKEQFVHQQHYFVEDPEMTALIEQLEHALRPGPIPEELLNILCAAAVGKLARFLPEPRPPAIRDDLPWPDPPEPFPLELEPIEKCIDRER
jgi:hypothetical protein